MSLWVIFDMKGVCNKLSAKKLPCSMSASCARLGWATVLLFLALPPQAKLSLFCEGFISCSKPEISFSPSSYSCGSPAGGKCQSRLHTHKVQLPALTWGQPPAQPWSSLSWWESLWVWWWLQALQCCARLGPNALWPCLPSTRCLLAVTFSLGVWGTLLSWAGGPWTFCPWVSQQKLTMVFNIGSLLNCFLQSFYSSPTLFLFLI